MSYWQRPGLQVIPLGQKSDALFLSWFAHDKCDPIIDHRLVDQLQACRQKRLLGLSPACLYNTAGYKQTTWSYYLRKLGGHSTYDMGKDIYQYHVVLACPARCLCLVERAQDNCYFVTQVIHRSIGRGTFHCYAAVIDAIDAGGAQLSRGQCQDTRTCTHIENTHASFCTLLHLLQAQARCRVQACTKGHTRVKF